MGWTTWEQKVDDIRQRLLGVNDTFTRAVETINKDRKFFKEIYLEFKEIGYF